MSFTESIWIIILPIIVGSGGVAGIVAKYYDFLTKKREAVTKMAEYRMKKVDEKFDGYMELASAANQISSYSKKFSNQDQLNSGKLFLSLLKFSKMHEEFVTKGDMLLTDHDAESVIVQLSHKIAIIIRDMFQNEIEYWEFRDLDSSKTVAKIMKEITNPISIYKSYFEIINKWFKNQNNSETKKSIENITRSIDQLLMFEINLVFQEWYGGKFHPEKFISKETLNYILRSYEFREGKLNKAFPKYYTKILYY